MADVARRSWAARTAMIMAGLAGATMLPISAEAATTAAAPATVTAGTPSTAAAGTGAVQGPRHEVTYFYGGAPQNMFDAYWHAAKRPQPGILILHGGYWVGGDKGTWHHAARWFADRGYAVFSANYRLAQQAAWPAQRTDALDAIAYIKRHAAQFDLDPDRLAVLGSSAGGQIAADIGTYGSAARRIRGVVALSPVAAPYQAYLDGAGTEVTRHRRKLRRTSERLAGCRPGPSSSCWSTWYDMTPKNHVGAGDVPMFLAFSRDDLVSPTEGLALREALRAHGLKSTFTVLPGGYHAGALLHHYPHMYNRILAFLNQVTRRERTHAKRSAEPGTVPNRRPPATITATPSPTTTPTTTTPRPTLPQPPTPSLPTPTLRLPGQ